MIQATFSIVEDKKTNVKNLKEFYRNFIIIPV